MTYWPYDYPFCVVPQGWYFFMQQSTVNNGCSYSVMWEAIKPEQLDEGFYLAQLAGLAQNNLP